MCIGSGEECDRMKQMTRDVYEIINQGVGEGCDRMN